MRTGTPAQVSRGQASWEPPFVGCTPVAFCNLRQTASYPLTWGLSFPSGHAGGAPGAPRTKASTGAARWVPLGLAKKQGGKDSAVGWMEPPKFHAHPEHRIGLLLGNRAPTGVTSWDEATGGQRGPECRGTHRPAVRQGGSAVTWLQAKGHRAPLAATGGWGGAWDRVSPGASGGHTPCQHLDFRFPASGTDRISIVASHSLDYVSPRTGTQILWHQPPL